ncbi:hypothetical protein M378DRAFT_171868 [Amanita muscaria Koide BX008]|uniref:Uncharacterized protein n=1 Tax=Amanita muscaria (strain Koide BX008) TaxID=946122 RepID=A0A0C2WMC9_AMAMK|nr:hypothetical protein M378DRAFT_171868 [Amanita muscaria Koide BX008]
MTSNVCCTPTARVRLGELSVHALHETARKYEFLSICTEDYNALIPQAGILYPNLKGTSSRV